MRLAIITDLFTPSIGGQEVRYLEMGRALVAAGHRVDVYTIRTAPDLPSEETIDGISVLRVVDGFNYQSSFFGKRNVYDILKLSLYVLVLQRSLRKHDVVLFNMYPLLPQILYRFFVYRFFAAGPRVIVDWCEIRSGNFWAFLYRAFASNRFRHVAVANHVRQVLVSRFRIAPERTKTILSGVTTALYECRLEDKQDKTILFLGRLTAHKNPLLLLESFCDAGLVHEGFSLHIAGGGRLLAEIRSRFGTAAGVHIHGRISDQHKVALLTKATLLVLPSRIEGFPRVIAEAAASGTPSLTTRYPDNGAVRVVEEYSIGWVCEPDSLLLARAIRERGAMSEQWMQDSMRCRDTARRMFDWTSVCDEFLVFAGEHTG